MVDGDAVIQSTVIQNFKSLLHNLANSAYAALSFAQRLQCSYTWMLPIVLPTLFTCNCNSAGFYKPFDFRHNTRSIHTVVSRSKIHRVARTIDIYTFGPKVYIIHARTSSPFPGNVRTLPLVHLCEATHA